MKKRFAALCLTCSALLSLSAPAAAVRAPNDSGQPQSSTGNTSVTIPSDGTLSFDQIGPRVKANNLILSKNLLSLRMTNRIFNARRNFSDVKNKRVETKMKGIF